MTRIGRRLIEDFLLPALNEQKYGDLLKWVDKDKCYFSIRWSHKNAAKWTLADTAVFQDWDKLKGHYHPEIKGYYMQAKQRFRAALYKLNTVIKLPCEDKHVKKYQLILDPCKRKSDILARKQVRMAKKEGQKSIPTPVICKNTSYVEKPKVEEFMEEIYPPASAPPSPASSTKSSDSSYSAEYQKCIQEYHMAKEQQKQMLEQFHQFIKKEPSDDEECISPLRDSNSYNYRKTPHVPIQPLPVYNSKCSLKAAIDNNQRRYESPHVLLVQTYNDLSDDGDQMEEEISERAENSCTSAYSSEVLNLSTKIEECEVQPR
ncbi:uncharacterized protein LOC129224947 [Uloborus diversus]|uniref:uncharacterized protein LOC129224947 n=1 Tax=Uloborus diversus TaxID=327109 RepID=UPI00240A4AED|nr:uncharacterized protein LOC129224947 [Uloborus diversus]